MSTHRADTIFASSAHRIMHRFPKPTCEAIRERDPHRGSGHHLDVGAPELVAGGDIKLARGQVTELTGKEVVLDDGARLPACPVVHATGFRPMNGLAADLVGRAAVGKVGKVWGLGSETTEDPGSWEGGQRTMWKPTRQENPWFHGGNPHRSRCCSHFLASQPKARVEGLDTPAHRLRAVHHPA